jgi:hypothetical protein
MAKIPAFITFGQSNMRGKGVLGTLSTLRASQYPATFYGKYTNWYWWYQDFTSSNPATGTLVELDFQPIRYGADAGNGTSDGVLSIADSTKVWPVNILVGATVTVGANSGTIASNTATSLTVAAWAPGVPGAGAAAYTIIKAVPTVAHPIVDSQPYALPYPTTFGPALPLTWRLLTELETPIVVINLGIDSAYISRADSTTDRTAVSWFDSGAHKSFATTLGKLSGTGLTSQQSLSRILMEDIVPAANTQAALISGFDGIDIQGIFSLIGESEGLDSWRASQAGQSMSNLLTYMEGRIDLGGYSSLEGAKIPKVIGGVNGRGSIFPYVSTVMDQYEELAATSRYIKIADVSDLSLPDGGHYDTAGLLTIGDRFYDAWDQIRATSDSAMEPAEDRPTLIELRVKVKRRYERNTNSSDVQDPLIDQLINDSLREFYQVMGDAAWFLNRIESLDLDVSPITPVELPQPITRVLRIEDPQQPGSQIDWKEIGYTQQGRLQIIMSGVGGGTYNVHHLYMPRDLTEDGDVVPVPRQYEEAIVTLALRRMAETANNPALIETFTKQAANILLLVKGDAKKTERQRKPTIDGLGSFSNLPFGRGDNIYGAL